MSEEFFEKYKDQFDGFFQPKITGMKKEAPAASPEAAVPSPVSRAKSLDITKGQKYSFKE
jgi:hypothetical protein